MTTIPRRAPQRETMMVAAKCEGCEVEILSKDGASWHARKARLSDLESQIDSSQQLFVIFARASEFRECQSCGPRLSALFAIPAFFWTLHCKRSNGYFGCSETYTYDGTFESSCTWFRFLVKQISEQSLQNQKNYAWFKMNFFTRWWPSGRNAIICFDPPPALRMGFPIPILDSHEADTRDPFWIHARLVELLVQLHDEFVWSIRTQVRNIELERILPSHPNPDYPRLHEISRHSTHSTETLGVAVATLENILLQYDHFAAEFNPKTPDAQLPCSNIRNGLLYHSQMLTSLKFRSEANRERLQNEITLAFNTVAQYDSKVSVQIGEAAKRDSAAMKTIAFLTMTFLPAMFICSIFSMSFFNFNPGDQGQSPKWTISEKVWIYWAIAVPLTSVTAGMWVMWQRYLPAQSIRSQ